MTCEQKEVYEKGIYLVCLLCGELTENMDPKVRFDFTRGYSSKSGHIKIGQLAKHCTTKYFKKFLKKFAFDEIVENKINENFFDQESILKEVLGGESRKNSLSVSYKLYKLLQHQGISHPEIKLSWYLKTLKEHDRIMKTVWDKLGWTWIDTH